MIENKEFLFMADEQFEAFEEARIQKKTEVYDFGIKKFEFDVKKEEQELYGLRKGNYVSIVAPKHFLYLNEIQDCLTLIIKKCIKKFLKRFGLEKNPLFFVVGLGNRGIVSDSLGNCVTKKLLATTYVPKQLSQGLGRLCYLNTSVSALTGISSFLLSKSIIKALKPDLVVVIDTLLTHDYSRLGGCFQISDAGITPGAGVDNPQTCFDEQNLGCKVLSIGVPMLIQSKDLAIKTKKNLEDKIFAPKEVDLYIQKCSKIIAEAINITVHKSVYKKYI